MSILDSFSEVLHDYFNMSVSLPRLTEQWGRADERFSQVPKHYPAFILLMHSRLNLPRLHSFLTQ